MVYPDNKTAETILAGLDNGELELLLSNRNRHLGSMFISESALDYLRILYRLLRFRRDHELEVLNDVLYDALNAENEFPPERYNQEIKQLEEWGLIEKRLEKTRLRSYKDVRRDRFRYRLTEETISFLYYLEERLQNDLLPHDDDSINLLEFILNSLKQVNRGLKTEDDGNCIFAMFDVHDKTARLSQNLSRITAMLGDFLLRTYSVEDARQIVAELGVYFSAYLKTLETLRLKILSELNKLDRTMLEYSFAEYCSKQRQLPRVMRSVVPRVGASEQIDKLLDYYKRNGRVDQLCSAVNDNAMRVLGKLTAFIKELERRSNRLEFLNLRINELSRLDENYDASPWLWNLLRSPAAPLDPNDSDEYQRAEPPAPRSSTAAKRVPPRSFRRVRPLAEEHVETHEEMRMRLLGEFIHKHYPDGGSLDNVPMPDIEAFKQIMFLLKRGMLGHGEALKVTGYRLKISPKHQMTIAGPTGILKGPETIIRENISHG